MFLIFECRSSLPIIFMIWRHSICTTGCSLNIFFFLKIYWFFWTLPVLLQRWFSTCLVCVDTLTPRENRVRNIFLKSEKNTIFNEHPVYIQEIKFNGLYLDHHLKTIHHHIYQLCAIGQQWREGEAWRSTKW